MTKRTVQSIIANPNEPPSAAKRNRKQSDWDKKHPVFAFYLPERMSEALRDMRATIKAVGKQESVSASACSEELLKYGLHCHARGELQLKARPQPDAKKLVLQWSENRQVWPRQIEVEINLASRKSRRHPTLSYRWSKDTRAQVAALAEQHAILPGETALALLAHALDAYKAGRMSLTKEEFIEYKINGWSE